MELTMDTQLVAAEHRIDVVSIDELPDAARLVAQFWREAEPIGEFKSDVFVGSWKALLSAGAGGMFIARRRDDPVGAIGFLLYPDANSGELMAMEAFWYVRPDARGVGLRLLDAYESAARASGARGINIAHLCDGKQGKLERLFERRGYKAREVHYWREL